MITFFTTAKPFKDVTAVQQENCLRSLLLSVPGCEILVFDPVEGASKVCRSLGISEPLDVERSDEGTPRIDSMFGAVAAVARHPLTCFINCDILLTPDFAESVSNARGQLDSDFLMVGGRIDVECTRPLFDSPDWISRIDDLRRSGTLHAPVGSDYFVFETGRFRRENMPPLLVGRGGWDNWMIYESLRTGMRLVDLSPQYRVLHQNHDYTHRKAGFSGYKSDPEALSNKRFMPQRKKGAHAYHLYRCNWEMVDGKLRRKLLEYPTIKEERLVLGGPAKADAGALETPVALILFRRPETTRKAIDSMRTVRPKTVYAVADGPDKDRPGEGDLCEEARREILEIDWPCRVCTDFSDINLGLARRVKSGLDRVFSLEEHAIILEDDVVAGEDFFRFCERMLELYSADTMVYGISGTCGCPPGMLKEESHFFSRYQQCWGWATWRRAWTGFDLFMEHWPETRRLGRLVPLFENEFHTLSHWTNIFELAYRGKWDSWAYPWMLHCWMAGALAVHPVVNLTSNIGTGPGGTHTTGQDPNAGMPVGKLVLTAVGKATSVRNTQADESVQRTWYELLPAKKPASEPLALPKPGKRTGFLRFLRRLRVHYAFEKISEALAGSDIRSASHVLASLREKDLATDRGVLLKTRLLLAEGKESAALKLLHFVSRVLKSNALLSVVESHLQLKKDERFLAENPGAREAPFVKEPSLVPLLDFPRFTRGCCSLEFGGMEFVDAASALFAYGEIFHRKIYNFKTTSHPPRIIDCGANIGLSVIYFKKRYPKAVVIAFEPDPDVFEVLQRNAARYCPSGVELHNKALWAEETEIVFNQQGADAGFLGDGHHCVKVSCSKLSDHLMEPVDFLKIDIEGAELEVLREAHNALDKVHRLYVEYHSFSDQPQRLSELLDIIRGAGFRFSIESAMPNSNQPFRKRYLNGPMDCQLHIFAWRPECEPESCDLL